MVSVQRGRAKESEEGTRALATGIYKAGQYGAANNTATPEMTITKIRLTLGRRGR